MSGENYILKMIAEYRTAREELRTRGRESRDGRTARLEDLRLYHYFETGKEKYASYKKVVSIFSHKNLESLSQEMAKLLSNKRYYASFKLSDEYAGFARDYRTYLEEKKVKGLSAKDLDISFAMKNLKEESGANVLGFLKKEYKENKLQVLRRIAESAAIIQLMSECASHPEKYRASQGANQAEQLIKSGAIETRGNGLNLEEHKKEIQTFFERLSREPREKGFIMRLDSRGFTTTSLMIVDQFYLTDEAMNEVGSYRAYQKELRKNQENQEKDQGRNQESNQESRQGNSINEQASGGQIQEVENQNYFFTVFALDEARAGKNGKADMGIAELISDGLVLGDFENALKEYDDRSEAEEDLADLPVFENIDIDGLNCFADLIGKNTRRREEIKARQEEEAALREEYLRENEECLKEFEKKKEKRRKNFPLTL